MLSIAELTELVDEPLVDAGGHVTPAVRCVDLSGAADASLVMRALAVVGRRVGVTIGVLRGAPAPAVAPLVDALDITLGPADVSTPAVVPVPDVDAALQELRHAITARPVATVTLCRLLRLTSVIDVTPGLVAESLAYSTLQAGPEFRAWLGANAAAAAGDTDESRVVMQRTGDVLCIWLNRPRRHNAYDARMRDALVDALSVAVADDRLRVELRGHGPSFSSGGDLHEFGTAADPATAHVLRISQSAGAMLHGLRERTTVFMHGTCIGAGVELPAFAGRVVAAAGTTFRLPEVAMGLVPGAGGTVSVTRRIGRWRTAWLAVTGNTVDAGTAAVWGLVDDVET